MLATSYGRLLRLQYAPRLVAGAFVGRIPMGMASLALVLFVARQTGSYAHAGWAVGAYAVATGLGTPIQGRVVDRLGPRRVLASIIWCETTGWVATVLVGSTHGPLVLLLFTCALAGAARPALSPVVRMMWPRLIADGQQLTAGADRPPAADDGRALTADDGRALTADDGRSLMADADRSLIETAMAFEGILVEVFFTLGPLLTAVIVSLASPAAAVLASAGASLTGTLMFVTSPMPPRHRAGTDLEADGHATAKSMLRSPATVTLVASMLLMGAVFGTFEVGVPAFAAAHGDSAISGVALAANSLTSMLGGIVYGAYRWRLAYEHRYRLLAVAFAVLCAPLVVTGTIPVLVALMALSGLAIAPLVTTIYVLIEATTPRHSLAEAYGWAVSGITAGTAAGAALSGVLAHSYGIRAPFVLGLGCGVVLTGLAYAASPVIASRSRR